MGKNNNHKKRRMKKIYFLFSLGLLASAAANAQQIDGTFDEAWVHSCPWDSQNLDGYQKLGSEYVEPAGWQISNVSGMNGTGATRVGAQVEGRTGYAVQLTNTANAFKASQIVPAYLTLGTPWATSWTKNLFKDPEDADGGTWGSKTFNYRPDAITFYYKRSHGKNSQQNASVVAYLWKGTYTQADVPANNAIGSTTEPVKVTMEDRDRQVLGIDMTNCLGGATSATEGAQCIAKVNSSITGDAADWTPFTAEFNYTSDAAPEKINVIFAACDYFADRSNHVAGDQLVVDDVQLVYYHTLSALSYDGTSILADGTTDYDLSAQEYNPEKLAYTKKAKGGSVETAYDVETAKLTISVKGDNYDADNTSVTDYTLQFKKAEDATVVSTNTYDEKLVVSINGQSTDSIPAKIVVDHMSDGTINFSLKNFYLPADEEDAEPMYVGNITLEGVTVEQAEGYETIATDQKITIEDGTDPSDVAWIGPFLGEIPVKLSGKLNDKKLYVNIDIDMQESLGQTINVVVGNEGDVTGIHSATVAPASTTDAIYTLSGVRVSKATKGVYIINGKKVIK